MRVVEAADVSGEFSKLFGVSPAQMEVFVVEDRGQLIEHSTDALAPFALAHAEHFGFAYPLFIGLAFFEGVVPKFEVGEPDVLK